MGCQLGRLSTDNDQNDNDNNTLLIWRGCGVVRRKWSWNGPRTWPRRCTRCPETTSCRCRCPGRRVPGTGTATTCRRRRARRAPGSTRTPVSWRSPCTTTVPRVNGTTVSTYLYIYTYHSSDYTGLPAARPDDEGKVRFEGLRGQKRNFGHVLERGSYRRKNVIVTIKKKKKRNTDVKKIYMFLEN